jgi:hypothetical protein
MKEKHMIYLPAGPNPWGLIPQKIKRLGSHSIGEINNWVVIYPEELDQKYVNPESVALLHAQFDSDDILLIDRLKGATEKVTVVDHVNRSGFTFLRGETPFRDKPMFPDISRIYSSFGALKQVVVHTIGAERFNSPPSEDNVIWSETAGQISPLFNYIGFKVFAIGHLPF